MEGEAFLEEDTDRTLCRSWILWNSTRHAEKPWKSLETFENPSEECLAAGATPPRNGPVLGCLCSRLAS